MPTRSDAAPMFLFDGDCGFCTTSAQWLERRLGPRLATPVDVTPYQYTDLAALGTDEARANHEALFVDESGDIAGGAQAIAQLLKRTRGVWRLAGAVIAFAPVRPLAAVVYRLVANNRSRLPGGTPACAMPRTGQRPDDQSIS